MCGVKEYANIQTGEKLDLERVSQLKGNALLKVKPELWEIWDFKKNDELGFDIWKMTKGTEKNAWWLCGDCDSKYDSKVEHKSRGNGCPYCAGKRVNHTNSLASLNPELAFQWHTALNGELTPHDVSIYSNKKVWWLGTCGHEWDASVGNRGYGKGCPYCSKGRKKVLVGFNDMWTTNPELASLLANLNDGYLHTQSSSRRVDWKCQNCEEIIKEKRIRDINKDGLSCPKCSDGLSYSEKFMYILLKELNVVFIKELSCRNFEWVIDKRYDFYIPSLNMIIETHGEQHLHNSFKGLRGRTVEKEKENDKFKRELASQNGINYYIELDCSESNMEYMRNSIMNSELISFLDLSNVDWGNVALKSEKSLVYDVCDLWNKGVTTLEIIKETMLCRCTVINYLIRGGEIGICNYNKQEAIKRGRKLTYKKVIQLNLKGEYVETWNSMKEASNYASIKYQGISKCCKNKQRTAGGYKWMYKEDYENYTKQKENVQ